MAKEKEMTLEEARAFRAKMAKPNPYALGEDQRREAFRIYWAQEKANYGKSKDLEPILWLHLKSIKMDSPDKFEKGLLNFGLKKVK